MMYLNTDPLAPAPAPRKPCARDMSELLQHFLPEWLTKFLPMPELERRAQELANTHPRFVEELPLALQMEQHRRLVASGQLHVAGRPGPMVESAQAQFA
jgi:hypothetical protein